MTIKFVDNLVNKIKEKMPLNFGEAREAVRRKKEERKDVQESHKRKEFPVHYTKEDRISSEDGKKFLRYALSLIKREHPLQHDFMILRLNGWSIERIAKHSKLPVQRVRKEEAAAIKTVSAKIDQLRQKGIPIFADLPDTAMKRPVSQKGDTNIIVAPA